MKEEFIISGIITSKKCYSKKEAERIRTEIEKLLEKFDFRTDLEIEE